jgi:hypothetical protein
MCLCVLQVEDLSKQVAAKSASVEAMVKQSSSTHEAYIKLMEDNRSLKNQLRDFDLLFGDSRKKAV